MFSLRCGITVRTGVICEEYATDSHVQNVSPARARTPLLMSVHETPTPVLKIHCINLDASTERWAAAVAALESVRGVELVRFPAIPHRIGWLGCALSHASCIVSRLGPEPFIIVMEDENVFRSPGTLHADLTELIAWLGAHADEWDVFNANPHYDVRLPTPQAHSLTSPRIITCCGARFANFVIYNASVLQHTNAYLAELTAIVARDEPSPDRSMYPVDAWFPERMRCVTRLPFLCTQRDGWSSVEGRDGAHTVLTTAYERNWEVVFAKLDARSDAPAPTRAISGAGRSRPLKVGLCMIVRNEEHVIERALRSALRYLDCWVIVDTGSTDRTMDIIRATTAELGSPGFLYQSAWENFGAARTQALQRAAAHMDFAWMLDADDSIERDAESLPVQAVLAADVPGYYVAIKYAGMAMRRVQLFNLAFGWSYVGAVHEYPTAAEAARCGTLPGFYQIARTEGARSRDPLKYAKDAGLLYAEYASAKTPRTVFYLAQSCRDAGDAEGARRYYGEYVAMPGAWVEEKYVSYFNLAQLSSDVALKLKHTWAAQEALPRRRDAVYRLLLTARVNNAFSQELYAMGLAFAPPPGEPAAAAPSEHLFFLLFEAWQYYDELSIAAYWSGHHVACIQYAALALSSCTEVAKARITRNIEAARAKATPPASTPSR
jgi:glycosyltransferase involved in cell wall biosynthesis